MIQSNARWNTVGATARARGQRCGQTLDSKCVAEGKQTGSDLELSKTSPSATSDASYNCIHEHLAEPDLPEEALHSKDLANVNLLRDWLSFFNIYLFVTEKIGASEEFFIKVWNESF